MGFLHPIRRLDFWWHLKLGEVIARRGSLPTHDLFSYSRPGVEFIAHNWLAELVYVALNALGGLPLVIAANTLLLLAALAFVFSLCMAANENRRLVALMALIPALVLGVYSNVRTQSFSFAFFALYLWVLWEYRDGRRDRLWLLPLVMVLWVNTHGAFVIGLGAIALMLVCEMGRRRVKLSSEEEATEPALGRLAAALGLTAAATLVNPNTWRVYSYVRQLQLDRPSQGFVTEWQPPDITSPWPLLAFYGPLLLVMLALVYGRRPDLTEIAFFVAFAAFGFTASRNAIWFVLAATPLLARAAAGVSVAGRIAPGKPRLNLLLAAALAVFTVLLSPWVRPHLGESAPRPYLIEPETPIEAADFIAERELEGNIFHPQEYGDYMIWRLWPRQRVFIDGRVHLYDEELIKDYFFILAAERWQELLDEYDVRYALLAKSDPNSAPLREALADSSDWEDIYEDEVSIMYGAVD